MLSFKPKANKKIKICKKYTTTLDGKHNELMHEFSKDLDDKIPFLKNEKGELLDKLKKTEAIEQQLDIKDRILEITQTIKKLKNKKKDYYLDNSKYIFDYFEIKKNISEVQKNVSTNKNNKLDAFFKIKKATLGRF
jgi:DNA repair exonuclease SbcCD ATPase subunit